MRLFAMRLHVGNVDDGALLVEERHRQRNVRVLHPHALLRRPIEDKQHAGVRREPLAVHQAARPGGEVGCHFGADEMHTRTQLRHRQWLCQRPRGGDGEEQGKDQSHELKKAGGFPAFLSFVSGVLTSSFRLFWERPWHLSWARLSSPPPSSSWRRLSPPESFRTPASPWPSSRPSSRSSSRPSSARRRATLRRRKR